MRYEELREKVVTHEESGPTLRQIQCSGCGTKARTNERLPNYLTEPQIQYTHDIRRYIMLRNLYKFGTPTVDGNLAALRQYEKKQEDQEEALDYMMNEIQPSLDKIEDLITECKNYSATMGYDFTDDINDAIKDLL